MLRPGTVTFCAHSAVPTARLAEYPVGGLQVAVKLGVQRFFCSAAD